MIRYTQDGKVDRALYGGEPIATFDELADALDAANAQIKALREALHRIRRTAEMSAAIMRDPERTGGWSGAERTARAFDRIGCLAAPPQEKAK